MIRQALELLPEGGETTLIIQYIKAKVGEEQYQKFKEIFGWEESEAGLRKFQGWVIRHVEGLKVDESGKKSKLMQAKRRWSGKKQELLTKLIQVHLTIKPALLADALLKVVQVEALSALGPLDLETRFRAWLECTLVELGWKVRDVWINVWYTVYVI